ncbi:MAG TPA: alpha/beta fold hydrolase [Acidimicrobiales bacterium]|nr:alpha/beta fold hydrolase [Acidimicrobiales bacterium]
MTDIRTGTEEVETEDGVALASRVQGPPDAAVALILAHGFSMTSTDRRLAAVAGGLADAGNAVYTFDFRGHGRSSGVCTLGDLEIFDIDAVIRLARRQNHERVVVIGASMGGFVSLRHAALLGGEDAVIAISTPATWGVSPRMRARALSLAVHNRVGRRILSARGTRVVDTLPEPFLSPSQLAERISLPVAVVHGGRDPYVPVGDAVLLHERLAGPKRLVVLPEFGHAEAAYTEDLVGLLESLVEVLLDAGGGAAERC